MTQQIERKDHGDTDVREAMREVADREHKYKLASDLGSDGMAAIEHWDRRISERGLDAAREAGLFYATRPRATPVAEEPYDDDDHQASARAALRSLKDKAAREENLPHTYQRVEEFANRHGGLQPLHRMIEWHNQYQADPYGTGPRVAAELEGYGRDFAEQQQATQLVKDFESKHRLEPEVRERMQALLFAGRAQSMEEAHRIAKHELGSDVKGSAEGNGFDDFKRDVTAAQRQIEGPEMAYAHRAVAEWRARAQPTAKEERAVKWILENGHAKTIDEAHALAKRALK
jgi:hypothetical protein